MMIFVFCMRQAIWVFSSQNMGDHITLSIFGQVRFHVNFLYIPWIDTPIYDRFCKTKCDRHSLLNQ